MSNPRSQRGDTLDSSSQRSDTPIDGALSSLFPGAGPAPNPTYAAFSPATLSSTAPSATSAAKRRSTILVHQKSPLLLATPPQITRALAYSHPFVLPLNKLVGLLTWTTGDPWESFLLLAAFWAAVLYGDIVVRVAGPVALVLALIGGMYGRRFSPLSSSGWSEPAQGAADGTAFAADATGARSGRKNARGKNMSAEGLPDKNGKPAAAAGGGGGGGGGGGAAGGQSGHTRNQGSISEVTNTRHQKTLDEIVETLKEFTARCNILLEPLLELTEFLSTQRTPTSATTRPALTTLFVRILLCTPFWFLLTLPPLRIITTRRVILICGTILLTWHARVIRVTRAILWRSGTIRKLLALVTGLQFEGVSTGQATPRSAATASAASSAASTKNQSSSAAAATAATADKTPRESELTKALRRSRRGRSTGVRFTFIIYENQRRWLGLGWTSNMFAYERQAWTDEHNNKVPPRDKFELPEVEDGSKLRWRWVEGSRWRVDGVPDEAVMPPGGEGENGDKEWDYDGPGGRMGWVYYDNKWQNGRRGQDGWGRFTRRRKWYRDAELVEADDDTDDEGAGGTAAAANGTAGASAGQQSKTPTPTPRPPLPPRSAQTSTLSIPSAADNAPSPPELAVTPPTPQQQQHHYHQQQKTPSDGGGDGDERRGPNDYPDTASLLSTSSRSARFRPPGLRRRVTDATLSSQQSYRSRAASIAASSEDDAAVLGTQARMALQEAGNEVRGWGVGDEVRMGLE